MKKEITQLSVGTKTGSVEAHAALVVVYHKGHVLGFHSNYKPDSFGMPCGKIDQGEAARTAAVRELKEETGLDVPPSVLVLADILKNDQGRNIAIYLWEVPRTQERPVPVPTNEGTGEWMSYDEFLEVKSSYASFNRKVMTQIGLA